jgi:8-oxo-dGTP diphosphatase
MDNQNDNTFQVSVKALFFNPEGKFLIAKDEANLWDFPGGRIQKGEAFISTLKRECQEEMGLDCEVLETSPSIVYPTIDKEGRGRVMVFFKVHFDNLDFKPSDECVEVRFVSKEELVELPVYPQIKPLAEYL